MSDDVRARAEEVVARLNVGAGHRMDREDKCVIDALRAALAAEAADASASPVDATTVAPATAQPVAWAVFAEDASVPAYVSASRNRADQVVDSEAGRIEGYRLVPLYAAPPATGDAAAVREACAKLCDEVAAEDTADEREADAAGDDQLSAMARESVRTATYLAETIRALPRPAPAPADDTGAAERAVVEGFAWDVGVEVLRERHLYIADAAAGLTLPSDRYILEAAIARVMAREKYAALRGTKGA